MDISAVNKTVRIAVIDNSKATFTSHSIQHPYDGQIYIGYSPSAQYSSASMNILDVSMWYGDFSDNEFDSRIQRLNQQYGVSL
jgi:hypothetical protein